MVWKTVVGYYVTTVIINQYAPSTYTYGWQ